ncbi:hypothetical protein GO986_20945 [Deinococcus sp. HMF7620]|uniref:DUF4197 domain-containing protein n=1 Tax=Deinococcus arboris TaxID=2682977 RepID=A0A7C9IF66_9DEIO|nr:hypothetical protein [Deinococcus arboris]MVN89206.1 hypothetical protein [Deinococcus arboris]
MTFVRALALLVATAPLLLGGWTSAAANLPARPGSPVSPAGVSSAQIKAALDTRPVLRLMLMTLSLRELLRAGTLQLPPNMKVKLDILLAPLASNASLPPATTQQTISRITEALLPEQRRLLDAHMGSRESRALMLASQTRLAAGEAVSGVQSVLYLLIPGGRSIVDRLNRQPDLNPYQVNPANTDVLKTLMALLR